MSKKTKNILWIVGVCLVIAAAVIFVVRDVVPSKDGESENVETVDTVAAMDSVIVDSLVVDTTMAL